MKYKILSFLLLGIFSAAHADINDNSNTKDAETESYFKGVKERFQKGWEESSKDNINPVNKQYDIAKDATVTFPSHNSSYIPKETKGSL